jgi:Family of unknown function (DUF6527)
MKLHQVQHKFVEFIPEKLEPGQLYISFEYNTANHLCACGCGNEVVTIIGPADSSIIYNGHGVSISTSIGNSNFPCKSHYWISENRVVWERRMTLQLTALSRARDKAAKVSLHGEAGVAAAARSLASPSAPVPTAEGTNEPVKHGKQRSWWLKLLA